MASNERLLLPVANVLMELEVVRQQLSQPRAGFRSARVPVARSRSAER
jgi:hypothetical protein